MKNQTRRHFLSLLMTSPLLLTGMFGTADFVFGADVQLSCKLLKSTLYSKTPAEDAWLESIIKLMDENKLSRKTVYAAYNYSVEKRIAVRFAYFVKSLTILAKKEGVKLPTPPKTAAF